MQVRVTHAGYSLAWVPAGGLVSLLLLVCAKALRLQLRLKGVGRRAPSAEIRMAATGTQWPRGAVARPVSASLVGALWELRTRPCGGWQGGQLLAWQGEVDGCDESQSSTL